MFTGIIESLGRLEAARRDAGNLDLTFSCPFTGELKTDQSVAHNGVCLTVVALTDERYTVTAIDETLRRTNIGLLSPGDIVNLERCVPATGRLDGHIVQGHVDCVGVCREVTDLGGSWKFVFSHEKKADHITVEKGSICVNGVSLTVVDSSSDSFSVHLIPYTFEYTNFHTIRAGSAVNLEFDIVGKYVARLLSNTNR
jgi:riboflavin synthase